MRVVDITHSIAGPFCTQLLADLGADVVKIERPGKGDDSRSWGPPFWEGISATYLAFNRNKQSAVVDLKTPAGRAIVSGLVSDADVVVHNLLPATATRLGLDFDTLTESNSSLVYCAISAHGSVGPLSDQPGYDALMQASAGLMSVTGHRDAEPVRVGFSVIDIGTGMWAALGVLASLRTREQVGGPQRVDVSLYETALAWLPAQIMSYMATGVVPQPEGSGAAMMAPYEAFQTKDGYLLVAANNDAQWQRLCVAMEAPGLARDSRFASNELRVGHRLALHETIAPFFASRTTAVAESAMKGAGVACSPVRGIDQLMSDPQTRALEMIRRTSHDDIVDYRDIAPAVRLNGERLMSRSAPPPAGANTRAVLAQLGYGADAIAALEAAGVVEAQPEIAAAP
ncbi:CaiB/BaiF CoA transferase family protein [Nocardioides halotolerans]|uniref:CaiB/BaiF CoA transferase family protein n=1 Tax=Nocardioides halotolerans TaxID=433660 RepID=UPI00146B269F|nr:CoA transferase [Nocardioides halotolerans]